MDYEICLVTIFDLWIVNAHKHVSIRRGKKGQSLTHQLKRIDWIYTFLDKKKPSLNAKIFSGVQQT